VRAQSELQPLAAHGERPAGCRPRQQNLGPKGPPLRLDFGFLNNTIYEILNAYLLGWGFIVGFDLCVDIF